MKAPIPACCCEDNPEPALNLYRPVVVLRVEAAPGNVAENILSCLGLEMRGLIADVNSTAYLITIRS